jgi:hypothetical protein
MSGTTRDPWAGFEEVKPSALRQSDPWAAFEPFDPAKPEPEKPGILDAIGGTVRQAARGATFGFGDEIAAGVSATAGALTGQPGTWGERYDTSLAHNRQRDKAFEAEHPYLSLGAQVAGAVANPVSRLSGAGSLPARIGMNGAINAGLGAVAGFGEGEGGFQNRLGSAGTGAATGAVIGAALPAVGAAAAGAAKKVAPYLGLNVAGTDARRTLVEAMRSAGHSVDDVKTRLDPVTGQPMAIPDVAGEDVLGLAQTVARRPGPGMVAAREFVEQRGGLNQSGRLEGEIKRAISSGDWKSNIDALISARARTSKPAYDAALADPTPVNTQPIVDSITARIETAKGPVRDALRRAKAVLLNRDGAPDTTLKGLHESKLALDALIDRGAEKPISRVARAEVIDVQKALLAEMDAASKGGYAAARDAWAGPSRAKDAMELGKSLLKGADFDETADAIGKLSASEKDFFRIGVARALDDAVKGRGDTQDLTKLRQLWGSQAVRERVAAAFDDPKEFKAFGDFMDREMTMALTNQAVDPRAGSITGKLAFRDQQSSPSGPLFNALANIVRGNPTAAALNLMPRPAAQGLKAETAAELAPYLFSLKPGDRARLLDALMKQQNRDAAVKPWADRAGAGVLRGLTAGAVQLEN